MDEENNWKEFSDDISKISKKIKSSITDEENIEDLKESLSKRRRSCRKQIKIQKNIL